MRPNTPRGKGVLTLAGLLLAALAVAWSSAWRQDAREGELGMHLAAASRPGDIEMLSSQVCGYCTQAREWFRTHRVSFNECFIETDSACAQRFVALNAPGTPVLVVRGQAQVGFDPERVARALLPR